MNGYRKLFGILWMVFIAIIMVSCGSNDPKTLPVSEGRFIDSPIAGARFETETQKGSTDHQGTFLYVDGETIKFFVGDIFLGQTPAAPIITLIDLVEDATDETNPKVTNLCRFLITLDNDGDPANGIFIDEAVRDKAVGMSIDFSVSVEAFKNSKAVSELMACCKNGFQELIGISEARKHLARTLANLYRYSDDDNDGFAEDQGDCDDGNANIYPGSPEPCISVPEGETGNVLNEDKNPDENEEAANETGNEDKDNSEPSDTAADSEDNSGNEEAANETGNEDKDNSKPSDTAGDSGDNSGNEEAANETGNEDKDNSKPSDTASDSGEKDSDEAASDLENNDPKEAGGDDPVDEDATGKNNTGSGDSESGEGDDADKETPPPLFIDIDGDGFSKNDKDCDDNNAGIFPGAEEICGDNIDQDCDGKDQNCPKGDDARLKISVRTASEYEGDITEIHLNVKEVLICGMNGCQVVGGPQRVNLLDSETVAFDLTNTLLKQRKINRIWFVLEEGGVVVVNGETHPLTLGGEHNRLQLKLDKELRSGKQQALLIDFDPAENIKRNPGQGYVLNSKIRVSASIEAPKDSDTAVVDPRKGGKFQMPDQFEMAVPAGAINAPAILWEQASETNGPTPRYTLGPEGTVFNKPVTVSLNYDPEAVPEGASEEDLVILHDGEPILTRVDTDAKTIEGEIEHFSDVEGGVAQAVLVYQRMVKDCPDSVLPGDQLTVTWYMQNQSNVDAVNYKLKIFNSTGGNFQISSDPINISAWGYGNATIHFTVPNSPGEYKVWFDILDSSSSILEVLPGGRLWIYFTVKDTGTTPVQALTQPILVSPFNGATDKSPEPTLDWNNVANATVYRIFIADSYDALSSLSDTDRDCNCIVNQTTQSTYYNVPAGKLNPGETYYWMVRAGNDSAGSPNSEIWRFKTASPDTPIDPDPNPDPDPDTDPGIEDPDPTGCGDQATLVYGGEQIIPAGAAAGEPVTVVFTLNNQSGVDAVGYKLQAVNPAYNSGVTYPAFTINSGATGSARIEGIPNPAPGESIYFDLVDGCGKILPPLSGGRMYIGDGSGPYGPCASPTAPTINYVDLWQSGCGNVGVSADVTGNEGDPSSEINGVSGALSALSSGLFGAVGNAINMGINAISIAAQGMCNTSASFGPINTPGVCTDRLGDYCFKSTCNGFCGKDADPVNTAIGNFFYRESDAAVAGLGGTTIKIERNYNSMAALWTPASIKRYTQTEDGEMEEEVVAGPPQYFGQGWTSSLGEFLLVVDMEPQFKGLQLLYADGHTALFEESGGGVYTSDSPNNFDEITKEGNEYVLRQNSCKCSLDSKRFNADGKLIAISDRNGNEITFTYDGDNLASVENASGRKIEFISDNKGRITKAALPEGIILEYEYTDDLLTAFINGRGLRTEYRYDGNKQMIEMISPKSHPIVQLGYDGDFLVSEQVVGKNEKYSFEFKDDITKITDAYGSTAVHHYDNDKRLIQLDYPDGNSEIYNYNNDFNRTYYMDQAGAEWHWTYDENGNRLTADGPLGWHREWEYNEKNQVTRMAEKVNETTLRETTFEYDEKGNLLKFCNALGNCGSVAYDSVGLPLELTDFSGNKTVHSYDAEGDLITVTDAEAAVMKFNHDGLGRVTQMTRPMGSMFTYTYDPNSNLTAVDGPLGYHMGFSFDENDHLSVKTDPNGGEIHYSYNASDRLASVENQLQFTTAAYVYGLMNELKGVTDAEGRSWSYDYDKRLRVTQVNGPIDTHFLYAYNPVGKITDFTDANGIITHTEYDDLYRPVTVIRNYRPAEASNSDTNVTVQYAYNLVGDLLSVTDPEGFTSKYAYDLQSRRTKKQDAQGYEWEFTYDPMGNLLKSLNPRGFTTSFEYTPTYRVSRVINPETHAVSFIHDADGRLTDQTDAKEIVTHFEYDELGRRIRVIRNYQPATVGDSETNVTSKFVYDLAGNLIGVTNPRGYDAHLVYDAAHRRTEMADFEDGKTLFAYDKVNNLLQVTDAEGNSTFYVYDDLNRMTEVTNAEEETKGFAYDPMGNRTHMTEADGTVTFYGYDAIYRLNQVTQNYVPGADPGNDINVLTQYAYDARGLLTKINNANGAVTAFDYNSVGRMIQETDPLNNVWKYAYDGMGNRVRRVDANGALTEYDYYPDDLLDEIRYADGTAVKYTYDPNNNRVTMSDSLGMTAWAYDPLNRIVQADDPFSRTLKYGYDAAGNRVNMVYPDGNQVGYTYSPNNWMASVTDPKALVTQYERDKVGNLTHIANPNNTETDYEYDRVYRTLNLVNRQISDDKTKTHSAFAYTYNKVGHVTQAVKEYGWRNPPVVTETYAYDGLHRLAGAVIDPIKNNGKKEIMSYEYDPVGNRLTWESSTGLTSSTLTDGFTRTYAYNAANQLLNVNVDSVKNNKNINLLETYTYDANGNRINRVRVDENDKNALVEGMDYAFDPENRMIQALEYQLGGKKQKVRTDRAVTDLEYDGGGRRLSKHYDPKSNDAQGVDKEVQYVFDGLDPVAEYKMLNGQRENFYRGANNRIITMHHFNSGTQGQMYWYHYNFKGDVAGMTKHNGNSHHTYRYDPYGGVVPETGNFTDPHNHYTLTGKEFDENTGLVWFGARHYDPEVGVWLTQDLYRGRIFTPNNLHRYGYILNSPINYFDLYGFRELKIEEYNKMVNAFKEVIDDNDDPNDDVEYALNVIGGTVADNIDNFPNACTIRMSHALNAFEPLPDPWDSDYWYTFGEGYNLTSGGYDINGNPVTANTPKEDKLWYARYVRDIIPYLEDRYNGTTIITEESSQGFQDVPNSFIGKKGIIIFYVNGWNDATGHVDFWDGQDAVHKKHFDRANKVQLYVAAEPEPEQQAESIPDIPDTNSQTNETSSWTDWGIWPWNWF